MNWFFSYLLGSGREKIWKKGEEILYEFLYAIENSGFDNLFLSCRNILNLNISHLVPFNLNYTTASLQSKIMSVGVKSKSLSQSVKPNPSYA